MLAGDRSYLCSMYCRWWFDWFKRQVKIIIRHPGRTRYGDGAYISSPAGCSLAYHRRCLGQIAMPNNLLAGLKIIAVDPLYAVTGRYVDWLKSRLELYFFPVAVLHHDCPADMEIQAFFQTGNTLSSSLLDTGEGVTSRSYVVGFSFSRLLREFLAHDLIKPEDALTIRMNCEGAELGVLRSLEETGLKADRLLGSIGDIRKNFGDQAHDDAIRLLAKENIEFQYFKGSDPSTWVKAFEVFEPMASRGDRAIPPKS